MEENNKHKPTDELLRSRFEAAEEQPSSKAWVEIEKRLDGKDRRPAFIYWLSGILVLLVISGGALYYVNQKNASASSLAVIDKKINEPVAALTQQQTTAIPDNTAQNTNNSNSLTTEPITDSKSSNKTTEPDQNSNNNENKTTSAPVKEIKESSSSPVKPLKTSVSTEKNESPAPVTETTNSVPVVQKKEKAIKSLPEKQMMVKENPDKTKAVAATNKAVAEEAKNKEEETASVKTKPATAVSKTVQTPVKSSLTSNISTEQKKPETPKQVKPDSVTQVAATVPKVVKDSAIVKKDSVKSTTAKDSSIAKKDSLKPETPTPSPFLMALSVYYSPDIYNNTIHDNSGQNVKDEKRSMRYTAGVKFSYAVLDKLVVRLGLAYSEIVQKQEEHKVYFDRYITEPFVFHSSLGDMPVDPNVMRDGFSPMAPATIKQFFTNYTYSQNVKFIHIPLEVKYGFTFKRIGLSVLAGVNTQYAYKQHAELDLLKEHVTNVISYNDLHMNKLSFSGILGLSADCRLTDRLSLFVEPHVRMNFTSLSKSSDVKSNPYFFGANAGLAVHF